MDEYRIESMEPDAQPDYAPPWESGFYETGSTQPPKNHAGVLAALLAIGILLAGFVGTLRLLNIELFHINSQEEQGTDQLAFLLQDPQMETKATEAPTEEVAVLEGRGAVLEIQDSQSGVPNVPQSGGLSLQQIYAKVIPSVVSITCDKADGTCYGTGVIMSEDGYLITNNHLIAGATSVSVLTGDQFYPATLIGGDEASDLAVLYIAADHLTASEFGDSEALQVGDAVVAIGDPLGIKLRGTMTDGIISAINRDIIVGGRTMNLLQTNAALNSGNAGGPLVNCYGQIVGINTVKVTDSKVLEGVEGVGFAIPSTTVKDIVNQLLEQGYVAGRPSLGIEGESVPTLYQRLYHFPSGLYINKVQPGSNAEQAGLLVGDILLMLDETRINDPDELRSALYAYEVGDRVEATIYRDGWEYTLTLTVVDAATGKAE